MLLRFDLRRAVRILASFELVHRSHRVRSSKPSRRARTRPSSCIDHSFESPSISGRSPSSLRKIQTIFPTPSHDNLGILVVASDEGRPLTALVTDVPLDEAPYSSYAQFFGRWTYEATPKRALPESDFDFDDEAVAGYRRIDNIADAALHHFRESFGEEITKDDIFYFVYGSLHHANQMDSMLQRSSSPALAVSMARDPEEFLQLAAVGAELMDLHLNFDTVEPYAGRTHHVTSVATAPPFLGSGGNRRGRPPYGQA
ncbi:type ISP restriction/modification enzyme [Ammonicoccus fulvus]|uniref:Type ISP restriction/modification enzyme n=1 Tax=Ammonicoccus fulvus TaxID=3138240 RepID=A0ABZ3FVJ5_9ACTN